MNDTINDVFRSGALGAVIPPSPASPFAQTENSGGPLNIRHIKRCHGFTYLTGLDADITFSSNSWADVHPSLALDISTSDRPLLMQATATIKPNDAYLALSFALDGSEVTTRTRGLALNGTTSGVTMSLMWVANVVPGSHRVSLVARALTAGSGTIYCVNDVAVLAVREI